MYTVKYTFNPYLIYVYVVTCLDLNNQAESQSQFVCFSLLWQISQSCILWTVFVTDVCDGEEAGRPAKQDVLNYAFVKQLQVTHDWHLWMTVMC